MQWSWFGYLAQVSLIFSLNEGLFPFNIDLEARKNVDRFKRQVWSKLKSYRSCEGVFYDTVPARNIWLLISPLSLFSFHFLCKGSWRMHRIQSPLVSQCMNHVEKRQSISVRSQFQINSQPHNQSACDHRMLQNLFLIGRKTAFYAAKKLTVNIRPLLL